MVSIMDEGEEVDVEAVWNGAPEEAEDVVMGLSVFFCAVLATRVVFAADLLDNDGQESWSDAPSRTFGSGDLRTTWS